MRFAHTIGTAMAAISIALVYLRVPGAWWFVAAFALLKTVSALGCCPASKLYGCVIKGGGCCAIAAKR
jgi:phosphatidylglycerophosphate synthase